MINQAQLWNSENFLVIYLGEIAVLQQGAVKKQTILNMKSTKKSQNKTIIALYSIFLFKSIYPI